LRVRSPPGSVREAGVQRAFDWAGGFAAADSADDRAKWRQIAPPRAVTWCVRTRRSDDRWVAAGATLTTPCNGRAHAVLARRSDEGHGRHARPAFPGTGRPDRRRLDGVDDPDFARRALLGHPGEVPDHRTASRLGRRYRSGAAHESTGDHRVWIDQFGAPRRHGVLGVRNHANLVRGGPCEERRSTSRSAGRRPLGRRDSRSVVAHRRRDEAKDFERAPCNATKGPQSTDLAQEVSVSSPLVVTLARRHGRHSSDALGTASLTPTPCTR
jgi:hypothetical protein